MGFWGGFLLVVVPKHLFALVFSLCSTLLQRPSLSYLFGYAASLLSVQWPPQTSMLNRFLFSRLGWFLVSHHKTFSCLYGWSLFIQSICLTFYYIPKELLTHPCLFCFRRKLGDMLSTPSATSWEVDFIFLLLKISSEEWQNMLLNP